MNNIILYGIGNCDTIKKTRRWLEQHEVDYEFHDYRSNGSPADLIKKFLGEFPAEQLINRRGTTWRKLSEAEKQQAESRQVAKLLSSNPALIKRPLLNRGSRWMLGYDEGLLADLVEA